MVIRRAPPPPQTAIRDFAGQRCSCDFAKARMRLCQAAIPCDPLTRYQLARRKYRVKCMHQVARERATQKTTAFGGMHGPTWPHCQERGTNNRLCAVGHCGVWNDRSWHADVCAAPDQYVHTHPGDEPQTRDAQRCGSTRSREDPTQHSRLHSGHANDMRPPETA